MRSKPRFNTQGMKIMVTVWKRTAFIAVGELRQADSAVMESTTSCGGGRGVSKGWKRFQNGRVKAFFFESGGGYRILREQTTAAKVADVNVSAKEKDDEYQYEEKDGRSYHDLAVKGVLCFQVWILTSRHGREVKTECVCVFVRVKDKRNDRVSLIMMGVLVK